MAKAELQGILEAYSDLVKDFDPLLFLAREKQLQIDVIPPLESLIERMDIERLTAASNSDEEVANILLGLRSLAKAVVAELQCYILLKSGEPNKAWDRLIDAESGIAAAMRAHTSFEYLDRKGARLRDLEGMLFPPQIFLSAGLIVKRQVCSICQDDYENCEHIATKPYCGQFCNIILKEVTPDHVAIVEEPANRHCRITAFNVPDGKRDRMSWIITPAEHKKLPPDAPAGGLVVDSTIATIDDFGGEWPEGAVDGKQVS